MIHHKRHFSVQNITEREKERKERRVFVSVWGVSVVVCEEEKKKEKKSKI